MEHNNKYQTTNRLRADETLTNIDTIPKEEALRLIKDSDFTCFGQEELSKLMVKHSWNCFDDYSKAILRHVIPLLDYSHFDLALMEGFIPSLEGKTQNETVNEIINFLRNASISQANTDFSIPDSIQTQSIKNDILALSLDFPTISRLQNTLSPVTNFKEESKIFSYSPPNPSKISLINLKIKPGSLISFSRLKIDEAVLVFSDSEAKSLLEIVTYHDKIKEIKVNQSEIFVSLPTSSLKTRVINYEEGNFYFEDPLEDQFCYKLDQGFSGLIGLNKGKFYANYELFDGDHSGEFSVEDAEPLNVLGPPKHFAASGEFWAFVSQTDQLFWLNRVGISTDSFNGVCFEGPIDLGSFGELTDLVVTEFNVFIATKTGKLFVQGDKLGDLLEKKSRRAFQNIPLPPGRLVGLYSDLDESQEREGGTVFLVMENEGRQLYTVTRGKDERFPSAKETVSAEKFDFPFSSLKMIRNGCVLFDREGKIYFYGNVIDSEYPLKQGLRDKPEFLHVDGIVDEVCDIYDGGWTFGVVVREGNQRKLKEISSDRAFHVEAADLTVLRVFCFGDTAYLIGVGEDCVFEVEDMSEGKEEFTVFISSPCREGSFNACIGEKEFESVLRNRVVGDRALNKEENQFLDVLLNKKIEHLNKAIKEDRNLTEVEIQNIPLIPMKSREKMFKSYATKVSKTNNTVITVEIGSDMVFDYLLALSKEMQFNWTSGALFKLKTSGNQAEERNKLFNSISRHLSTKQGALTNLDCMLIQKKEEELTFIGKLMAHCVLSRSCLQLELSSEIWESLVNPKKKATIDEKLKGGVNLLVKGISAVFREDRLFLLDYWSLEAKICGELTVEEISKIFDSDLKPLLLALNQGELRQLLYYCTNKRHLPSENTLIAVKFKEGAICSKTENTLLLPKTEPVEDLKAILLKSIYN